MMWGHNSYGLGWGGGAMADGLENCKENSGSMNGEEPLGQFANFIVRSRKHHCASHYRRIWKLSLFL
jgi:hypothetical protein